MESEQQPSDILSRRPVEFDTVSDEVALGTLMGCLLGATAALTVGGLVGAVGAAVGDRFEYPALGGGLVVWILFWLVPLLWMKVRPVWLLLLLLLPGTAFVILLQWYISQKEIGTFYPWVLTALPLGVVVGTFWETIRLARGGSTEGYASRPGVTFAGDVLFVGDKNQFYRAIGAILGLIANLLSLGRQRIGAPIAGVLGGGLPALGAFSIVAWRGDDFVADLFFGSVWNIAWGGTAIGMIAGAASGWSAVLIRERQQRLVEQLQQEASDPPS